MTSRDDYVLNNTMENMTLSNNFKNKQFYTVQDNNSNYSTQQIYFQLSNIYNLNRYNDWSNAYIIIPVNVNVSSPDGYLDDTKNYVVLKNNLQLINSFNCSVNQTVIHQATNNINEYLNFLKHTEITNNTLNSFDYLNFYEEDEDLFTGVNAKHVITLDASNKVDNIRLAVSQLDSVKKKVSKLKNSDIENFNYLATSSGNKTGGIYESLIDKKIVSEPNKVHNYEFYCYIKLSDLSSFFQNCGMMRLFLDNLNLSFNGGSSVYKTNGADEQDMTDFTNSYQYNTCPILITGDILRLNYAASGSVPAFNKVANKLITFKVEIAGGVMLKKNCEMVIPSFQLDPTVENRYLSSPTREFYYRDVYYTPAPNLQASSDFSIKLNNSIANAIGVLVLPYFNKKNVRNSPVNIEPNLPTLGIALKNLNLNVGGVNVLLQNSNYNYEMFLNNLENGCINVLNGGFNLESSLLSLKKFNHSHRFYYFNCQNLEKVENVSQSVELKGANNSNVAIDLSIFIIYNRKVVISKTNGQILELTK